MYRTQTLFLYFITFHGVHFFLYPYFFGFEFRNTNMYGALYIDALEHNKLFFIF